MITYLITVNDRDAEYIDRWVERTGRLRITGIDETQFGVNVVDVVREPEGPQP